MGALAACGLMQLRRSRAPLRAADALAWSLVSAALLSSLLAVGQISGLTAGFEPWIAAVSESGAYANLRQRNQFASLTVLGFVALLYLVRSWPLATAAPLQTQTEKAVTDVGYESGNSISIAKPLGIQLAVWLTMGLLMLGNAASASRTGLVGVALISAINLGWYRHTATHRPIVSRWLVYLVLPMYFIATLVLIELHLSNTTALSRLTQGDEACSSRLTLWSNVLHLIAERPWTGWGWGELAYAHFMTLYPGERFCAILDNAHNLPLHLAVTLGVPASVLICGSFFAWIVWQRAWAERCAVRQMVWCLLAMLLLHSFLEYPLWYGPFQLVVAFCILLLWLPRDREQGFQNTQTRSFSQGIAGSATVFFILFLSYVAWDYDRISQIYLPFHQRSETYRTATMSKISGSWLFQKPVQFALLTTTSLEPSNAAQLNGLAKLSLHFSPEAIVVQKLIESAVMLGRDDEALFYLQRFRAAFPVEHKIWANGIKPVAPANSS